MSAKKEDPPQGWEIPAPAAPSRHDPWRGPGHSGPLSNPPGVSAANPFSCRICGVGMSAHQAYAYDGEFYCASCRPAQAVSGGQDLPVEPLFTGRDPEDLDAFSFLSTPGVRRTARLLAALAELLLGR